MTASSSSSTSALLDLTGVPLAELGVSRTPALVEAIGRTIADVARGVPADLIQSQAQAVRPRHG